MIRTVMNFVRAAAVCCIVGHPRGHILNPSPQQPCPGGNSDARPVPPPRSGAAVGLIVFIAVVVLLGLMLIIRIALRNACTSSSGASEIEAPWTQTPKHEQTAQGKLEQLRAEYEENGGLTGSNPVAGCFNVF